MEDLLRFPPPCRVAKSNITIMKEYSEIRKNKKEEKDTQRQHDKRFPFYFGLLARGFCDRDGFMTFHSILLHDGFFKSTIMQ